jgi:hypothetical protein
MHSLRSGRIACAVLFGLGMGCSSGHATVAAHETEPGLVVETAAQGAAADPSASAAADPCKAPAGEVKEPYAWYPALDMARIPFHTGSGPWGPQARIEAPSAPVTKRTVSVNTADELGREAGKPGTQILIARSITEQVVLFGDVIDIDVVVPKGVSVASLTVGSYSPPSRTQRFRIRGTMPMRHSGGTVGSLTFFSEKTSDIIVDGIDLNGEDGEGGSGLFGFRDGERVAVVNVRGHAVGYGGLMTTRHFVMAGSNFVTGTRSRSVNGFPEGWDVRGGDLSVYFRNYFSGTRYHRIRVHPGTETPQYAWIAENVFIDPYEARIVSAFDTQGTGGKGFEGLWAQCNTIYAASKCMGPSFEAPAAAYARLTHNAFYGIFTQRDQRRAQEQHGPNRDYVTKNTFHPWKTPPAPPAPGDPKAIPLPADNPADDDPKLESTPCPGP